MRKQGFKDRGFTLLELVLVLVILSTALGMAAPSLRGWSRGSRLRDAADQFVALTRLARTQAVSTSRLHRLHISPDGEYRLMIQNGIEFVPVAGFGQTFALPAGFRMEMIKLIPGGDAWIDFHPTGRTEPARIRISSDQADAIDITCASPAETFEIIETGGMP